MKILALDPGEKVGWATASLDDGGLAVDTHGISHLKDMALAIFRAVVEERRYDLVIYETWRLRRDKAMTFVGNEFPSVQFIGMVRLCCWLSNTKIVAQGPGVKQSTADAVLDAGHYPEIKKLIDGAPKRHDESHDVDALRHLVAWHWKKGSK